MSKVIDQMLKEILPEDLHKADAYNLRKDGYSIERKENPYIQIISKPDGTGIDIYVKEGTLFGVIDIPVIITESGLTDIVYNDFHIGKNANITIIAGCGIHNNSDQNSEHDGIHRFFLEENAKVKYVEKHYGEGKGTGLKTLNPVTKIMMKKGSYMVMDTVQIRGVDDTLRTTTATLAKDAKLVIREKILTTDDQQAKTKFQIHLKGENASTHVISRSVAQDQSYQEFKSNVVGSKKCYGHVECDAIIQDQGTVKAIPEIYAKSVDSNLVHEATIGKIAGEQFVKLMSLGLNEKEAEKMIINGFLK